jgi:bifunctional ADP-heptose synthase (sugar kinase/adenylyltransferase)
MAGNVAENIHAMDKNINVVCIHQNNIIKKTRYVDDKTNHMFLRVDEGDTTDNMYLSDEFIKDIKESDAVIISDYDKGFLSHNSIYNIASFSNFCVLDSKKKLETKVLENIDFVKLNENEFRNNSFEKTELSKVIVTRGINGTDYMGVNYPSPKPIQTMDVSGAGDTFTAAFTLKYLETKNIEQSIIYANEMASIVVSKRGVATP